MGKKKPVKDLECPRLKENTLDLIKQSKERSRIETDESRSAIEKAWLDPLNLPSEGDSDFIDRSIIPNLEQIQKNPNIITTSSCSGGKHSAYPYLSFVIVKDKEGKNYLNQFKKKGYRVMRSSNYRMGFFKDNFPECHITNEWEIGTKEPVSPQKAKAIWHDWTEVLKNNK